MGIWKRVERFDKASNLLDRARDAEDKGNISEAKKLRNEANALSQQLTDWTQFEVELKDLEPPFQD
jgi:hypothetical protein